MRRLLCTCIGLLLAGSLAACSTAQYAEPIKSFSDAATQASDAVAKMNTALADATLEYALRSATDPKLGSLDVQTSDSCGAFVAPAKPEDAVRCRPEFTIIGEGGAKVTVTREQYTNPMGNMVAVTAAIQKYAANLAAVQADNTADEVNTSIDKIQANLVALVQAADKNATLPSDLPAAAGEGVKWIFGQYIESVKFDALKKAANAAVDPLNKAKLAFSGFETGVKGQLSLTAMRDSARAMDERRDNQVATNRDALEKANAYDDFLTAPLSPMFDNLVAAHDKLVQALNGSGNASLKNFFTNLDQVKQQAEQIAKIATDIAAALKPKTT
ncbi:MAG TPA: hypothetical protein VMT54_20105 [Candidatus Cybelea sp.]|nr:hypothetical protein [Candidatus Cybelea sp.]